MDIALIQDGVVTQMGSYKMLFPETSFPSTGPNDDFLAENNAKKVNLYKPYDRATEKLVPVDPYVDGDFVYTFAVQALTDEEKASLPDPSQPA